MLDPHKFMPWLLPGFGSVFGFDSWRMPKTTPSPGESEREPDHLAVLNLLHQSAPQWLLLIEWQTILDALMFGRMLEELGQLWRTHRPTQGNPKDRFQVMGAVINLTGTESSMPASNSFVMPLTLNRRDGSTFQPSCILQIREVHLALESASETMERIKRGEISEVLLGLIPLMQGGGDDTILACWREMVVKLRQPLWRNDICTAAMILAELTEFSAKWDDLITGDAQMTESIHLNRWLHEGEKIGIEKGELIGKIEFAQRVLRETATTRKELEACSVQELRSRLTDLEARAFPVS
jgi:hypothetical protein